MSQDRMVKRLEPPDDSRQKSVRRGPPNRMNDLNYTEWMKFQKSFFRYVDDDSVVNSCIAFFTKERWDDDEVSRSLVFGFGLMERDPSLGSRIIDIVPEPQSVDAVTTYLEQKASAGALYDFIIADFRPFVNSGPSLATFLDRDAKPLFAAVRKTLKEGRYCCCVSSPGAEGCHFPYPWSIALASRDHLRLRDEKIAIDERTGSVFYCLFMQSSNDALPAARFSPESLRTVEEPIATPNWVIPKPPPRKRNEVLHPAKFPETLVDEFLRLFTEPGDTVFDPMVGTGSTVVAAIRCGRHAYGVDLVPEFVEIALSRVRQELSPSLLPELQPGVRSVVVQGDSTCLLQIPSIRSVRFNYSVTSPPYWSMLQNPGSENQRARRASKLRLTYSEDSRDLGNIGDYRQFLDRLVAIYEQVGQLLQVGGHLTVVVKNVKRDHVVYPLAWDLVSLLCGPRGQFSFAGTTLWCQDDVALKPFAVGIHWVSNTLHHYCLHFRKKE
jgi:DNA modification methylase